MHDIIDIAILQSVGGSAGINVTIGDVDTPVASAAINV